MVLSSQSARRWEWGWPPPGCPRCATSGRQEACSPEHSLGGEAGWAGGPGAEAPPFTPHSPPAASTPKARPAHQLRSHTHSQAQRGTGPPRAALGASPSPDRRVLVLDRTRLPSHWHPTRSWHSSQGHRRSCCGAGGPGNSRAVQTACGTLEAGQKQKQGWAAGASPVPGRCEPGCYQRGQPQAPPL